MTNSLRERKKDSYQIFNEIASTYDFLNHTLSFGIDIYWRNKFLKFLPKKDSINALDLACGTGDVPLTLIRDKRIKKITGLDLSKGMVDRGIDKVKRKGLEKKIFLMLGDAVIIPASNETFDLTTISFGIRNFNGAQESLNDIYRVLKPEGRLMIMEFAIPKNFFIRSFYFFYFRYVLPKIGNLISKHSDAYTYLNQSVEDFPYGDEFLSMMKASGFKNLHAHSLTFGIAMLYIGDKTTNHEN